MNKKIVLSALFSILLLPVSSVGSLFGPVPIPNQDFVVVEGIGDPETVDPAWAYDTASIELISNVYERLIAFDIESVENFVPGLAVDPDPSDPFDPQTEVISPDGLTYTFKIREGVQFHDGSIMTTEDVEYSFEHILVQDRSGGPGWMFFEPLFEVYHSHHLGDLSNPVEVVAVGQMLDDAIQANATHVWMTLPSPYPPFMQILSQSWASILNKDFCVANGDWPGWEPTYTEWVYYDDPTTAPLDVAGNVMCGTGPYMLDYWAHGVDWSIVKFDDYWEGWPAPSCSSYLKRVYFRVVYGWRTRLRDFRAGVADMVYVPRAFISQVQGWPGTRGMKDLPSLTCGAIFFNWDITMPSPYVGSGTLDGNGIPPDFFSDKHVRLAFAYAFNHTKYIEDVWLNQADTPPSPHIRGLAYSTAVWNGDNNPIYGWLDPVPIRHIDLAKVEEEMKLAFGGSPGSPGPVWTNGFKMTITYNVGNMERMNAALTLAQNMLAVNPDFVISTAAVTWSTYLGELWYAPGGYRSLMPIYITGWLADYPDPHNVVHAFQHSEGYFAYPSSYSNATVDAWIEAGIAESDPVEREKIYWDIAWSYYYNVPGICVAQPLGHHWERDWVQGWYYNLIRGGSAIAQFGSTNPSGASLYFRHLWKGLTGDINGDNAVDLGDAGKMSSHWYNPEGPAGHDRIADIWPELQYRGDLALPSWLPQFFPGLPFPSIGVVDVFDWACLNLHWGEYKIP